MKTKSMSNQKASHALHWAEQGIGQAGSVVLTAQRLIELQTSIESSVPAAMRDGFAVAGIRTNELTLLAKNAALASKLRQMQPSILKHVGLAGWQVDSLKIKVATRPNSPPTVTFAKQSRALDQSDLGHFETLAKTLEAGPLADAVKRLLERHGPEKS